MKQFEPKEVTIGTNKFYIFPFPAFKSANLMGELVAIAAPLIAGLAPLIGLNAGKSESDVSETENENKSLMNIDVKDAAPAISGAFNSLSGDKVERILKKLLIDSKNITVEIEDKDEPIRLTEDLINEIFCGEAQDMFVLAFYVIKLNFSGFFKKLGDQSGAVAVVEAIMKKVKA